jgi:hypothetical protein
VRDFVALCRVRLNSSLVEIVESKVLGDLKDLWLSPDILCRMCLNWPTVVAEEGRCYIKLSLESLGEHKCTLSRQTGWSAYGRAALLGYCLTMLQILREA